MSTKKETLVLCLGDNYLGNLFLELDSDVLVAEFVIDFQGYYHGYSTIDRAQYTCFVGLVENVLVSYKDMIDMLPKSGN